MPIAILLFLMSIAWPALADPFTTPFTCSDAAENDYVVTQRISEQFVQRLRDEVTLPIYRNCGYENPAALRSALESGDAHTREIWRRLKEEAVDFAMHVPEAVRLNIATTDEFKNRWDPSNPLIAKGAPAISYYVERLMYARSEQDFAALSYRVKPKYGFLRFRDSNAKNPELHGEYGEDLFIFRKDRLRHRVTFSPHDSLGFGGTGLGENVQSTTRFVGIRLRRLG